MIQKDSSSVEMCKYYPEMVEINEMSTNEVTLAINNVWVNGDVPTTMTVYVHDNGVNSVLQLETNDSFQCLDNDGFEVDIDAEDNSFAVQCYQATEDPSGAWLAAIDIVITDDIICGSNDVPHPCDPDGAPILESCSWRIVVPCSSEAVCTEEPSSSPTKAPVTDGPTASPTSSPTASPTLSPSATPTGSPIDKFGDDDDTDDKYFPPVGPEPCPDDILLVKQVGIKEYPHEGVQIIETGEDSVTVRVSQVYSDVSIDHFYYQYYQNYFNNKCFEEQGFEAEEFMDITIQCTKHSKVALLELWIADDSVETGGDNAVIPECCHPTAPPETPVTKYMIEIKCETSCPEVSY